jgi:small subunit ribosomal protein S20
MPIIKSAKKRVKVSTKANLRNVKTKRSMREALKAYYSAVANGNAAEIAKTQKEAMSALDTATKKAVIHKNKAGRKKAQLAAMAKSKGVKPAKIAKKTPSKTVAKKPAAKKPAARKTPAKKTASRK